MVEDTGILELWIILFLYFFLLILWYLLSNFSPKRKFLEYESGILLRAVLPCNPKSCDGVLLMADAAASQPPYSKDAEARGGICTLRSVPFPKTGKTICKKVLKFHNFYNFYLPNIWLPVMALISEK